MVHDVWPKGNLASEISGFVEKQEPTVSASCNVHTDKRSPDLDHRTSDLSFEGEGTIRIWL